MRRILNLSIAAKSAFVVTGVVVFVVALLTGGYFLILRTGSEAAAAEAIAVAAQQNQHDLCTAANVSDAKQIALWQYIIQISPAKTTAQKNTDQQFEAFLYSVFKAIACPPGAGK